MVEKKWRGLKLDGWCENEVKDFEWDISEKKDKYNCKNYKEVRLVRFDRSG